MAYEKAKVYFDGGHYIAIPKENFCRKGNNKVVKAKVEQDSKKQRFEQAYTDSRELPKKERKEYIQGVMQDSFNTPQETADFVQKELERKRTNSNKRKTRLYRKVYLQEWNYFVTITYSDNLHTEDSFKVKLRNTLKHLVSRKGWKYIGAFERSPNKRLHFHAIMYIPSMIGELVQAKDYSTKTKRMQVTNQNTHFLKQFGRNDFHLLNRQEEIVFTVRYLLKYIEKSNEKLIYGGKLPTYFVADIDDEDIVCHIGNGDKKALLFDDFTLWDEWCLVGKVSKETIRQMPKTNS